MRERERETDQTQIGTLSPGTTTTTATTNSATPSVNFREQLREAFARGSLDFDTWTSLISEIEKTYSDDIETICLAYDSFLSKFPLCYGYWRKYADHHARLCTVEKVVETFERAVQSATYSVGLWVEYCSFSMSVFEDPCDVRRIFKRGMSFVGKDYLCHALWDKYIEFELTKQHWSSVAHIYIQTLRFPTKKLHRYYDNFKKFTAILKEEVERHNDYNNDSDSEGFTRKAGTTPKDETSSVIQDLLGPSAGSLRSKALHKYVSIGEQFYQEACQLEEKTCCFETKIRRPYFHVKPLDDTQLENWHRYLDFVETQQDFDWVVKLYERCLIPCANYPEFWMRYGEFMESKGGREIANFAIDRASRIFLKNVPEIHLFNARFKEHIGDVSGARAAFPQCDKEFNTYFVGNVVKEANMEKRLGNFAAAFRVYEKAFEMAAERQKLHTVSSLYIHFSRLKYLITKSADAAMDVIINGIQNVPNCKLLLEGLINFAMMHGGPRQVNVVDSIIANAVSPGPDLSQGLSTKDQEAISLLYLEFVDYCGTTHDVRKGWNRHIKLFPHSVRPTSFNSPTSDNQLLNMIIERRQSNPYNMPDQPEDNGRLQQLSSNVPKHSEEDALEANNLNHVLVPHQSGEDTNEPMESTQYLVHQSREEEESGALHSPHDLEHQEVNDIVSLEASQEHTDSADVKKAKEAEFEQHLKLPSVESLSLNPQKKESQNLVRMDAHQATSTSDEVQESYPNTNENPSLSGLKRSLVTDSSQIQTDPDENKSTSTSFSLNHQNPKNNTVNASENAKSGLLTHLQDQEPGSPAETDSQRIRSQGYPHHDSNWQNAQVEKGGSHQAQNPYWVGAAQVTSMAAHAWPSQNMQQQTAVSISLPQQSPQQISQPQAQISPHPMKSSEQIGHPQSDQAFNQPSEYYYYQQQQQFQQHYLQQQQQQQQQPYQQPQPQQQQHDADPQQLMLVEQQQYLQQQQYYQQLQQQQYYQQLQQWQQYQQQQQEYQKQLQLAQVGPQEEYQKLQQLAEQQQQGYQQLLQQQQEYYQQMAQPQHQQIYHQPQQIASTHCQTWNGNYYQQGEVVAVPHGTGASAPAESPHPQQQSPQASTPAHSAGMPRSAGEQQSPQTQ